MKRLAVVAILSLPLSAQVRYEDILKGPGADWLTYAGDYQGKRHSPLAQITAANASSLVPKWVYHMPKANGLRTNPIVYQGVMYVTNSNEVRALDARTGRLIWAYKDTRAKKEAVNRGAAILGDKVFFVTADVHLVALDRRNGSVIWQKQYGSVEDGLFASLAPLVVKDKVLVGVAGGDSGMRGYIAAFRAETGEEVWRLYTVPARGEPGSETWGNYIEYGGAATWLSGTYDPDLNLVYWTTGNPWPDFYGGDRKGDNLYSCSLLAIDADTGKMKWYFQFTPHDVHDWDAQAWPVLVDLPFGGRMRKLVLHANRNGFLYVLDRVTGEYLRATPIVDKLDWATGIDAKGRPVRVPGKEPTPSGNRVCPGVRGATNWMSPSFNPATGLLYVVTLEQCDIFTSSAKEPEPKKNFSGGGAGPRPQDLGQFFLRAFDPKTGKRVWEYPMTGPAESWAGTVSTAGGVVFFGDDDGHLVAVDAKTGKHLWHFQMGEGLTASPITYAVEGKQYVAIASATAIFAFGLFEPAPSLPLPTLRVSQ
ncbi:MAG: PQQ-dependent dehydrogenase, methanol/ethanol family [Bryobacteraceae bacterium]|nr:PQQ-dependent dehydrogenase, methanol/ethanol family [Bryobacteraceae bacterium]MDW8379227.1 PQQ-dependent dehydrogenase, methanol/ethanol family [Bryobacterales bacterium]